jgi:ElaB/YqjD/DUF883 family membrane-anchored ribosome-binding protein
MDDQPEVIRQQMEETRSALTDKIGRLEQAVTQKVQAVTQTVDTVKETIDIRRYVRNHPWAALGAAVAVGFAGGTALGPHRRIDRIGELRSRGRPIGGTPPLSSNGSERAPGAASYADSPTQAAPSWGQKVTSSFDNEIGKLKEIAVGAALSLLRDWVARSAPGPVRSQLSDVIDDVTRKLGGEPIRGNLLDSVAGLIANGKVSRERETSNEARATHDCIAG